MSNLFHFYLCQYELGSEILWDSILKTKNCSGFEFDNKNYFGKYCSFKGRLADSLPLSMSVVNCGRHRNIWFGK